MSEPPDDSTNVNSSDRIIPFVCAAMAGAQLAMGLLFLTTGFLQAKNGYLGDIATWCSVFFAAAAVIWQVRSK